VAPVREALLKRLKVAELRDACEQRGLPTDGIKAVLISRVLKYEREQQKSAADNHGNEGTPSHNEKSAESSAQDNGNKQKDTDVDMKDAGATANAVNSSSSAAASTVNESTGVRFATPAAAAAPPSGFVAERTQPTSARISRRTKSSPAFAFPLSALTNDAEDDADADATPSPAPGAKAEPVNAQTTSPHPQPLSASEPDPATQVTAASETAPTDQPSTLPSSSTAAAAPAPTPAPEVTPTTESTPAQSSVTPATDASTPTPSSHPRRTIKLVRKASPTVMESDAATKKQKSESSTTTTKPIEPSELQQLMSTLPPSVPKPSSPAKDEAIGASNAPPALDTSQQNDASASAPSPAASSNSRPTPIAPITPRTPASSTPTPSSLRRRLSDSDTSQTCLRVEGFERPISVKAIESLLERYGKCRHAIATVGRWFALVAYDNAEDAQAAREGMQGLKDYPTAPRGPLTVKSSSVREVDEAINRSQRLFKKGINAATTQASTADMTPEERLAAAKQRALEAKERAAAEVARREELARQRRMQEQEQEQAAGQDDSPAASTSATPRTGRRVITLKKRTDAAPETLRITRRVGEVDDENIPMRLDTDETHAEEAATLTLDQLFRKTKFEPPLYWLPCTEEEIKQREEKERREKEMVR